MVFAIDSVGFAAASLTTLCWLPQAVKIARERRTEGVSLVTQVAFALGVALWLLYGIAIASAPVIAANAVTLALTAVIIALKLRFG